MKTSIKSSLAAAMALALASGQVCALGLGTIQVKSGLNQPLVAEIPVIADSPGEATGLRAQLASAEDFLRVGLSRDHIAVPIDFAVESNAGGQTVIKLTTKDIVREPFLDFLVEVNWAQGKLLREYTVLLDPPVTAPAVAAGKQPATVPATPPVATPSASPSATKSAPPPVADTGKPAEHRPKPVASTEPRPPPPRPAAPPHPAKPAASPAVAEHGSAGSGDHDVKKGETLTAIARGLSVTTSANLNQVMLALYKANPDAFFRKNINALKAGAVLRIPPGSDIAAAGSASEAAAEVQSQYRAWLDISKPTLVARTGGVPAEPAASSNAAKTHALAKPESAEAGKSESTGAAKKSEHLALVPPAGKGGETSTAAGSGAGGSGESAATRAELARAKESLSSREQESGELRARVKSLEELNDKSQRLISLKDSEIADLQRKLQEMQASKAAPGANTSSPANHPESNPPPPAKPADAAPQTAKPDAAKPNVPVSDAAKPDTAKPNASAPDAAKPDAAKPGAPAPDAAKPAEAPKPAAAAPAKPAPGAQPPKPAAQKPAQPPAASWLDWLGSPYLLSLVVVLLAGGGLLLSRSLSARKRARANAVATDEDEAAWNESQPQADDESQADGKQPSGNFGEEDETFDPSASTETLMDKLHQYYVNSDAAKFEDAALLLHGRLAEDSDEWQEVVAMSKTLLPQHPLFGAEAKVDEKAFAAPAASPDVSAPASPAQTGGGYRFPDRSAPSQVRPKYGANAPRAFAPVSAPAASSTPAPAPVIAAPAPAADSPSPAAPAFDDLDFSFDEPDAPPAAAPAPVAAPAHHPAVEQVSAAAEPATTAPPAAVPSHDNGAPAVDLPDEEDAVSTRLDLARAYLDMGDPDGARMMLDEVIAEGNAAQKAEAGKLLAEIH